MEKIGVESQEALVELKKLGVESAELHVGSDQSWFRPAEHGARQKDARVESRVSGFQSDESHGDSAEALVGLKEIRVRLDACGVRTEKAGVGAGEIGVGLKMVGVRLKKFGGGMKKVGIQTPKARSSRLRGRRPQQLLPPTVAPSTSKPPPAGRRRPTAVAEDRCESPPLTSNTYWDWLLAGRSRSA